MAILLLPGMAIIVVPAFIIHFSGSAPPARYFASPLHLALFIFGLCLMVSGLTLMAKSIRLFIRIGKGTLAPWSPTRHLVVEGVYCYVRNPMISGVFCILLGESAVFGSWQLLVWFFFFVLVNVVYTPLLEEPGLARRFGEEYLFYKKNVPRWIPRLKPWKPPWSKARG